MSYSLQLGFASLPDQTEAAVILLGDQPNLPRSAIAALLASRGDRPIVAGWAKGHPTPPVLIERSHFAVVGDAAGDEGLRELLLNHPEWVAAVELPEATADIDTQDDLRALEEGS
jgi:molybdenum cofactor cytidylyltransferase